MPQLSVTVQEIVCVPTLKTAPSRVEPALGLTPASVIYVNDVMVGQTASGVELASHAVPI